eukprot:XP_001700976.1 predicted protein [Chlamydomonas reinhardtii]
MPLRSSAMRELAAAAAAAGARGPAAGAATATPGGGGSSGSSRPGGRGARGAGSYSHVLALLLVMGVMMLLLHSLPPRSTSSTGLSVEQADSETAPAQATAAPPLQTSSSTHPSTTSSTAISKAASASETSLSLSMKHAAAAAALGLAYLAARVDLDPPAIAAAVAAAVAGSWRHTRSTEPNRLAANPHPAAGLAGDAALFVIARHGRLTLADGRPFRVAGLDVPRLMAWAAQPHTRPLDSLARHVMATAARLGLNTLRFFAFDDGAAAVPPWGGMHAYIRWVNASDTVTAFYTNDTYKARFFDYLTALSSRVNSLTGMQLRHDPTLLAWDLANRPTDPGNTGSRHLQMLRELDLSSARLAPDRWLPGCGAACRLRWAEGWVAAHLQEALSWIRNNAHNSSRSTGRFGSTSGSSRTCGRGRTSTGQALARECRRFMNHDARLACSWGRPAARLGWTQEQEQMREQVQEWMREGLELRERKEQAQKEEVGSGLPWQ